MIIEKDAKKATKDYHSPRNTFERSRVFFFLELISRFEFNFSALRIYFWKIRIVGVLKVQPHAMRLYMFAPTQFHFEGCGVLDDSRYNTHLYQHLFKIFSKNMKHCGRSKASFNRTSLKVSDVKIVLYTSVLSLSLSLCLCLCVCVTVSVCCVLRVVVVFVVEEG